jgi:hypothetical protein
MTNTEIVNKYLNNEGDYNVKSSNLSIVGNHLVSYRSKLATLKNEYLLIDDNISSYSVTTSKHTRLLIQRNDTLNKPFKVVRVYDKDVVGKLKDLLGKKDRCRSEERKEAYKREINKVIDDVLVVSKLNKELYERSLLKDIKKLKGINNPI